MNQEEYHKMAGVEDHMWYYRALHAHVRRELSRACLPDHAELLDAGCGTGGLLRHLQACRPEWQLSGMDLSPLACAFARERTGATITSGSVEQPPYAKECFDAITSCDVLCQVEDALAALRALVDCLRPGGVCVLTMPAFPWMYSYHDEQVGNLRRYTRSSLLRLMRASGLRVQGITYWNMLPFPLAVLRRKILPPRRPESDVRLYPALLEATFRMMMFLEYGCLQAGGRLPFGSSLLAIGRKPTLD